MSSSKTLFGFHAVGVRLKTAPQSILEIYVDPARKDARMRQFVQRAGESGVRLIEADGPRLAKLAGTAGHQGVVARVQPLPTARSLDDLLDAVEGPPLLLVLDGVTDPHNLGACLRVADGAGAHAVIAPKDHAVGLNATVSTMSVCPGRAWIAAPVLASQIRTMQPESAEVSRAPSGLNATLSTMSLLVSV